MCSHEFGHRVPPSAKVIDTDQNEIQEYKCVGCESCWTEKGFTVEYVVANQKVQFCLNCEDWIKDKSKVLDKNWTLFDQAGNLRCDV